MDQRLNFITLAVADTAASLAFYAGGLGWEPELVVDGEVVFFRIAPTLVLSLWDAEQFAAEAGELNREPGTAPITLAHNVPDPGQVQQVLDDAVAAGATLIAPAEDRDWGGRSGYFADPDGYRWEVAHNPGPLGVQLMQAAGLLD